MAWFDQIFGLSTVKSRAGLRVDRVDFDALQALVYRSLSQTIGAVLGEGAGCLTTPSFEVATSGVQWWVEVGACQIYYSHTGRRADGSPQVDALGRAKVIHGVILAHDPLAEGQGLLSRIEITDWLAAAAARFDYGTGAFSQDPWPVLPYLWARPVLVDVETGTRRVWSALTEAEEPVTGPTRTAARVEFRFATTAPAVAVDGLGIPQEPPWVKIAQIQSWALGTTFDLAGRSGPERPLVFPISAWDSDQWFRFTREAGTSGYEGRAESAGASDPGPYPATDPRFGLPPTSLITDGRLAAVYDDDQRAYVAAERAHTSGASAFLAPLPPWDAREGFAFPSSGRVQTADQPGGLGLIGLTHLLRDRFRAVQEGGLTLADDVNPRANSLDNTDVGTVPWWRRPRRGLAALDRALRALTDDTIPDLLAQLAAEVAARGCPGTLPSARCPGCGSAAWSARTTTPPRIATPTPATGCSSQRRCRICPAIRSGGRTRSVGSV
jgi:hypothetical protein